MQEYNGQVLNREAVEEDNFLIIKFGQQIECRTEQETYTFNRKDVLKAARLPSGCFSAKGRDKALLRCAIYLANLHVNNKSVKSK